MSSEVKNMNMGCDSLREAEDKKREMEKEEEGRRRKKATNSPQNRCETPWCDNLCPELTSAPSGRVQRKTLDLWLINKITKH